MAASSCDLQSKSSDAQPAMDQRFEELESRLAFLDHTVEELNRVVVRQDQEIRLLQQQVAELMAKLHDLSSAAGPGDSSVQHEIPPHY